MEQVRERVQYLVEENLAAITSPIVFELLSGARLEHDLQRLKTHLSSLHPFPFLPEEWSEAAEWTHKMRKKSLRVKIIDALIAYKAIKHNLTLLHADADMDRMARRSPLRVESYVDSIRRTTRYEP